MLACPMENKNSPSLPNVGQAVVRLCKKAFKVAKHIASIALILFASTLLLLESPYAFLIVGVFGGALFKDELKFRINNPLHLWNKNFLIKMALIFATTLTWPVASVVMSAWAGAKWSVFLLS